MRSTKAPPRGRRARCGRNPAPPLLSPIAFLAALVFFAFLSCAAISSIDGRPLAAAALPIEVLPSWRPFPGFDGGACDHAAAAAASAGAGAGEGLCLAYFSGRTGQPRLEFHALRVCLRSPVLRIVTAGGMVGASETLSARVSSFVRDGGLLAGINALPFDPVSGREGEPRVNIGVVISEGRVISPPRAPYDALVFFRDGSAAVVPQSEIGGAEGIANAVGGFRRILEGGEVAPRAKARADRHPRSAAGVSPCGGFLYLLAIDGRRAGSVGSTEEETALLLRSLGAAEGINFDGGGSTALAMRFPDGEVRAVNAPIHRQIRGMERAVAGVLGVGMREE